MEIKFDTLFYIYFFSLKNLSLLQLIYFEGIEIFYNIIQDNLRMIGIISM